MPSEASDLIRLEDVGLCRRMPNRHNVGMNPEVRLGFRQNTTSLSTSNLVKQYVSILVAVQSPNSRSQPIEATEVNLPKE